VDAVLAGIVDTAPVREEDIDSEDTAGIVLEAGIDSKDTAPEGLALAVDTDPEGDTAAEGLDLDPVQPELLRRDRPG